MFASSTAFLTAAFSSSDKAFELSTSTFVFGSFIFVVGVVDGVCAIAFDSSVTVDVLLDLSVAVALTSVPSLTLSAGITIFPSSIFKPLSAGSNVQVPSSPFVAVTVFSLSSLSLYFTVTDFKSSSVGGVMLTLPSLFAVTFGTAGAVVSGVVDGVCAVAFDSSVTVDVFPVLSVAVALTSVPSLTLSAGITIFPSSIFNPLSAGLNVQVPSSPFVAVTSLSLLSLSLYFTVTDFKSLSVGGVMLTLPSLFAVTFGTAGGVVSGVA